MDVRKVGVEEELMLVDPSTGALVPRAARAVRADEADDRPTAEVGPELFLQQVETSTPPCEDADDLAAHVRRGRAALRDAADAVGAVAVAVPTPVLAYDEEDVTPKERYLRIHQTYGELARQALVCAMHLHVDVADDEEAVRVVDGIRPWLPVLVAISANSPFWSGRDTGHASWRSQVWSRWPTCGPQSAFGDVAAYRRTAEALQEWGAAMDAGMLYFDVRLAEDFPTVEIRVADVCTEVDDAVLVALLGRALVATAASLPAPEQRTDLLRAAGWRAARFGLAGPLVHPVDGVLTPTREVLDALLDHVGPALSAVSDADRVRDLVERLLARGGGAARQRAVLESTGELGAVVEDLARRTHG